MLLTNYFGGLSRWQIVASLKSDSFYRALLEIDFPESRVSFKNFYPPTDSP
jgi:hypothetical protein